MGDNSGVRDPPHRVHYHKTLPFVRGMVSAPRIPRFSHRYLRYDPKRDLRLVPNFLCYWPNHMRRRGTRSYRILERLLITVAPFGSVPY